MRNQFHKSPSVSLSELSDFASYVTGRKVYTAAEINAMDEDTMDRLGEVHVHCEDGTVRELHPEQVDVLYGPGWEIVGFRPKN